MYILFLFFFVLWLYVVKLFRFFLFRNVSFVSQSGRDWWTYPVKTPPRSVGEKVLYPFWDSEIKITAKCA